MTPFDAAWQAALAAEQRAVFGYALLGPHLTAAGDVARARSDEDAHTALRDATSAALAAVGVAPGQPEADYPDLYPVTDASTARQLAVRLEREAAAAWRYLYAVAAEATGTRATRVRAAAQAALTDSAVRAAQWGGHPVAFPGV